MCMWYCDIGYLLLIFLQVTCELRENVKKNVFYIFLRLITADVLLDTTWGVISDAFDLKCAKNNEINIKR